MERRVNLMDRDNLIYNIVKFQTGIVRIENIINNNKTQVNDEYIEKLKNDLNKLSDESLRKLYYMLYKIYLKRNDDLLNYQNNNKNDREEEKELYCFLDSFIKMFAAPLYGTRVKYPDYLKMLNEMGTVSFVESKEELIQMAVASYRKIVDYNYENQIVIVKTPIEFLMKRFEDTLKCLSENNIAIINYCLDTILVEMASQYGMNATNLFL